MGKYYMVFYEDNYADEHDIMGFKLFTGEEWDRYDTVVTEGFKVSNGAYCGFGTNQGLDYSNSSEYWSTITVKEITKEYYDETIKLFGYKEYGFFMDLEEQML